MFQESALSEETDNTYRANYTQFSCGLTHGVIIWVLYPLPLRTTTTTTTTTTNVTELLTRAKHQDEKDPVPPRTNPPSLFIFLN